MSQDQLNRTFIALLDNYRTSVIGSNYQKSELYIAPVREYLLWLQQKGVNEIGEYATDKFTEYCDYLIRRPNRRRGGTLSERSLRNHFFALRLFFEDLLQREVIQEAVVFPKFTIKERKEREVLSEDEIQLLYDACKNKLERSILNIGYGLGLRRSEMANLSVSDLDISTGMAVVRKGKGSKRREVPMSDRIIEELRHYIVSERHRNLKNGSIHQKELFINTQGNPVSGNYLNRYFKAMVQRTGDEGLLQKDPSLHNLRHSIGNHMINRGASIEFVRDFLGHSEIDTAALYAIRRNRKRILPI